MKISYSLLLIFLLVFLTACGDNNEKRLTINASSFGDSLVISRDTSFSTANLLIHNSNPDKDFIIQKELSIYDLIFHTKELEIINIPENWQRIEILDADDISSPQLKPKQLAPYNTFLLPSSKASAAPFFEFNNITGLQIFSFIIALYLIIGLTLAWTQFAGEGLAGFHILFTFFFAFIIIPTWEYTYLLPFLFALAIALVIFFRAMVKSEIKPFNNFPDTVIFVTYATAILTMLVICGLNKDFRSYANWVSHDNIQLYIPASARHSIIMADAAGKELANFSIPANLKILSVLTWPDKQTPASIKIISPDGDEYILYPGERPTTDM
jgi:hypothetical protein